MSETWLQSYARTSVLDVFKRIQHGQLNVVVKYLQETTVNNFGEQGLDESRKGDSVSLVVKSPDVWGRLTQAFALVGAHSYMLWAIKLTCDQGFAEAYMLQELECDNLMGLFFVSI